MQQHKHTDQHITCSGRTMKELWYKYYNSYFSYFLLLHKSYWYYFKFTYFICYMTICHKVLPNLLAAGRSRVEADFSANAYFLFIVLNKKKLRIILVKVEKRIIKHKITASSIIFIFFQSLWKTLETY